jgi:hypothetical protein
MAGRKKRSQAWDDQDQYTSGQYANNSDRGYDTGYDQGYDQGNAGYDDGYGSSYHDGYDNGYGYDDDDQGLILNRDQSLVNVSSTITQHGAPLLSYTSTMSRFYAGRKQRLSLGRHKCQVCGERIRFWSFSTPDGKRTHDACYERLAWAWTNLYAHQQRLAADGQLD